jgi:hypothetical protein
MSAWCVVRRSADRTQCGAAMDAITYFICAASRPGQDRPLLGWKVTIITQPNSDVQIVADIRLAMVGNATMLLIDSSFHNRKSPTSAKNNLVRVNSTRMHPK